MESDKITYKHDAKYSELKWVIATLEKIIGIRNNIDIDIDKDRLEIFKNELEGLDDITDNVKYIRIPYMKSEMTYLNFMSEIGEYAKELAGEIVK